MALSATFPIVSRLFLLTNVTPPGSQRPLQGFAIAGAIAPDNLTHYLVTDQHGGTAPIWVAETQILRAEIRKDG